MTPNARWFAAIIVIALGALWAPPANAREFRCVAQVNYRQLEGSSFTFLDELKQLVEDYMNKNNWTDDSFELEELIECSMQIIFLQNLTLTSFRAQLVITSTRPIYGTTAKTIVLQVNDNQWEFTYAQGNPLVFETERYDALTTVLDYYAYLMLAYDYDTFSEMGGEEHFQKAKRIQQMAAPKNGAGWSGLDREGRSSIVDQMTGPQFRPLRLAYFQYHFNGLDHFTRDTDEARDAVLGVLATMQELYNDLARQYVFDVFFSTKYKELAAIFEESGVSSQAYALLVEVDPSHLTTYGELVQ